MRIYVIIALVAVVYAAEEGKKHRKRGIIVITNLGSDIVQDIRPGGPRTLPLGSLDTTQTTQLAAGNQFSSDANALSSLPNSEATQPAQAQTNFGSRSVRPQPGLQTPRSQAPAIPNPRTQSQPQSPTNGRTVPPTQSREPVQSSISRVMAIPSASSSSSRANGSKRTRLTSGLLRNSRLNPSTMAVASNMNGISKIVTPDMSVNSLEGGASFLNRGSNMAMVSEINRLTEMNRQSGLPFNTISNEASRLREETTVTGTTVNNRDPNSPRRAMLASSLNSASRVPTNSRTSGLTRSSERVTRLPSTSLNQRFSSGQSRAITQSSGSAGTSESSSQSRGSNQFGLPEQSLSVMSRMTSQAVPSSGDSLNLFNPQQLAAIRSLLLNQSLSGASAQSEVVRQAQSSNGSQIPNQSGGSSQFEASGQSGVSNQQTTSSRSMMSMTLPRQVSMRLVPVLVPNANQDLSAIGDIRSSFASRVNDPSINSGATMSVGVSASEGMMAVINRIISNSGAGLQADSGMAVSNVTLTPNRVMTSSSGNMASPNSALTSMNEVVGSSSNEGVPTLNSGMSSINEVMTTINRSLPTLNRVTMSTLGSIISRMMSDTNGAARQSQVLLENNLPAMPSNSMPIRMNDRKAQNIVTPSNNAVSSVSGGLIMGNMMPTLNREVQPTINEAVNSSSRSMVSTNGRTMINSGSAPVNNMSNQEAMAALSALMSSIINGDSLSSNLFLPTNGGAMSAGNGALSATNRVPSALNSMPPSNVDEFTSGMSSPIIVNSPSSSASLDSGMMFNRGADLSSNDMLSGSGAISAVDDEFSSNNMVPSSNERTVTSNGGRSTTAEGEMSTDDIMSPNNAVIPSSNAVPTDASGDVISGTPVIF